MHELRVCIHDDMQTFEPRATWADVRLCVQMLNEGPICICGTLTEIRELLSSPGTPLLNTNIQILAG